jgi:hypothetical protein
MIETGFLGKKCWACYIPCELKEKRGDIALADLAKAPWNCPYKFDFVRPFAELTKQSQDIASIMASQQKDIAKYLSVEQEAFAKLFSSVPQPTFSQIENIAKQQSDALREFYSKITPTYYPPKDFEIIGKPIAPPSPESLSAKLIDRLSSCEMGREHWQEFQQICEDILTHLFVPPLGEPIWESRTDSGLERRDLIFQIPYNAGGFWQMISYKYSASALIVSCKNYSDPIRKDEVLDLSQYLAKTRLGNFGIILSRYPASESAIKEAKLRWRDDEKMIICLDDEELENMIQLKDNNNDPEKLVEKKIFDFLASLE